jgi:hypothetical protein
MDTVELKALHSIEVRNKKGRTEEAVLRLRYGRIRVLPPIGKQSRYPNFD